MYCSWLVNNVENTNDIFINFLKKYGCKYEYEKFIYPDINNFQNFLFNGKICLNKFLDTFNDIFLVFFTINFYKKNNSNIIVYYNYSFSYSHNIPFKHKSFIFFDKNRNIEIFQIIKKNESSCLSNFFFIVNKNIPESKKIHKNLNYDFYGILNYEFYRILNHLDHHAYIKYNEYHSSKKNIEKIKINNFKKQLCKKYLNYDIETIIEEYL